MVADIDLNGTPPKITRTITEINSDGSKNFSVTIDNPDGTGGLENVWEPIGTKGSPFKGSFNGKGHEISNMVILKKSANQSIGLFGVSHYVTDIHIKGNSYVIADFIDGANGGSPAQASVGGITGCTCEDGSTSVNSSSSSASIYSNGSFATGGVIGVMNSNNSDVSNMLYSTGAVYAIGGMMVGGVAGGTTSISYISGIQNSYSTGNIYTKNVTNVGGIYGYGGKIIKSYYAGDINASGGSYIGGLAGSIYGGANLSYARGMINGSDGNYVGGLSGMIAFNSQPLTNCYYNGEISKVENVYGSANAAYDSTGISLTTTEMTGQGVGRADEKMIGFKDAGWVFTNNSSPEINGLPNEKPQNNEIFIDPSEPEVFESKSNNIKGWQTPESKNYQVNIIWGDMEFVYDKGKYNSVSGNIEKASTKSGVEAGATDNDINKWYGFDGTNNKITIQNISTGKVKATALTSVSEGETNIHIQTYFKDGEQWNDAELESAVPSDLEVSHDSGYKMKTYGENKKINSTLDAAKFDENGQITNISSREFFFNITGKPQDGFSSNEAPDSMSTIGKITINFQEC